MLLQKNKHLLIVDTWSTVAPTTVPFIRLRMGHGPLDVIALDIHLDIECRDEDHDGLVGNGSHGFGVSYFVLVSALAGVFYVKPCFSPR